MDIMGCKELFLINQRYLRLFVACSFIPYKILFIFHNRQPSKYTASQLIAHQIRSTTQVAILLTYPILRMSYYNYVVITIQPTIAFFAFFAFFAFLQN
jgi:hypothetical protein